MRSKQNGAAVVLLVVLLATLYGVYQTGQSARPTTTATPGSPSDTGMVVDQSSLTTAEQLVRLPTTTDERPLAEEALHLGDQEMDLAFAEAVREAVNRPHPLTAEAQAIAARLGDARTQLSTDQATVDSLADSLKTATAGGAADEAKAAAYSDRLDLVKAQLSLDQDEIDDASQDLIRAGGDPQGRMQAMTQDHDAASKSSDSVHVNVVPPAEPSGMIHAAQSWWAFHEKVVRLGKAKAAADSLATAFAARHAALDAAGTAASQDAAGVDKVTALLLKTQRRTSDAKTKTGLDERVDDQRSLATLYRKWIDVVGAEERDAVHRALAGLAFILAIVLVGVVVDSWIEHIVETRSSDRRYVQTLGIVTRVSLQVVGALFILLVIFGPPNNLGTFLGLAGAGLTVALKDFIIGFFGWFVLIGKNGIRLGDVVEINGVTGEVVELGMFHTILLETGAWTESGNPTGRRVRFTNSFAIEGHYINFSTSGQWLWDEIRIVVPAGRDPYPVADVMRKQVEDATADSVRAAEAQWKGDRRSPLLSTLTAAPAISVKPIMGGMEITVRYIAQVADRSELRAKLYHTAVDLLGGAKAGQ